MLLIKAKGGLGNRLLSAATAIAYAESTDRDWFIDWSDGLYAPDKENAVQLLFPELTQNSFCLKDWQDYQIVPRLWEGREEASVREVMSQDYAQAHSSPSIYRVLSAPLTSQNHSNEIEIFWSYTSKYGRIKRFLNPDKRRLGRDQVLGQILRDKFRPGLDVVGKIDNLLGDDRSTILGVHVRYTDLKIPLEKLMASVDAQVQKFNYQSIFLATDNQKAEEQFKQKFPKVITQAKHFPQGGNQLHKVGNDERALDDAKSALVDLFALSLCAGLVYCSRSTFAETSRLVGAIDPEKVLDVDRYNLPIRLKRVLQEYL